jgi:GT2 family glycosyltransferase
MALEHLDPGGTLGAARGDAVICIPLHGAHDLFVRCIRSVLTHTPPEVAVLVADDHGPDPASEAFVEGLDAGGRRVAWMRQPENLGFVGNMNAAFAAAAPADVVILNSDCVVAEGWFQGLRDAALSDQTIATATALTNNGTLLSVPHRNDPRPALPQDISLDEAARRVRERSLRLRPRLPTAVGHCVYTRRDALELVGGFDPAFAPAYGEEVDWSQRCLLHGLQHVAADDVLVLHQGHASLGVEGERNPLQDAHDKIVESRYPHYLPATHDAKMETRSPLARALGVASRALRDPRVTIDGRCLGRSFTGTQVHALEVISALHRTGRVRLRVLLPAEPGEHALGILHGLDGVELLDAAALPPDGKGSGAPDPDDVVHRTWQLTDPLELRALMRLGSRLVITHQDLIAYRNPGYHAGGRDFLRYRQVTEEALAAADRVLFFSEHAARDAQAEELVTPERTRVVLIGVDHHVTGLAPQPQRPAGTEALDDAPFLLCIGTDFRHKNRGFALRVLEALRARHDWPGRLVLAGAPIVHGSSAGDEAAWLAAHPELEERVVALPAIGEPQKAWLYERCAAVLYPSTYEGFGLIPFEAADAGKPCLFAHRTSVAELLPPDAATIVAWDPAATADRAIEVLEDPERAAALVQAVRAAGERYTWDATARELLKAYDETLRLPASPTGRVLDDELLIDARYWALRTRMGDTAMALVDPDGGLLPEEAQRALARLAKGGATRGPLVGALRGLHRLANRGRE